MLKSEVCRQSGRPVLRIDGAPVAAMAYTTYFEERSRYEDFLDAGFRIFFDGRHLCSGWGTTKWWMRLIESSRN